MTAKSVITHKINKVIVGIVTLATAGIIAFGGLVPVGAQAVGTYDCGTYGGGNYDETDCTDPVTSTGGSSSGSTSSGSSSSSSGSSSSSSSTGSASTGSTSTTTETPAPAGSILLNAYSEYRSDKGKTLTFKLNDKFYFNLKGAQHTITIKSISSTELVVTIASTPTDVTVPVGQTVSHDTDGDGTDDIAITYASATGSSASDMTGTAAFRSLATTTDTSTQNGSTGPTASTGGTTDSSSPSMWWVWLIPIVLGLVIIAAVVGVVLKRRKANGGTPGGTNFGQF